MISIMVIPVVKIFPYEQYELGAVTFLCWIPVLAQLVNKASAQDKGCYQHRQLSGPVNVSEVIIGEAIDNMVNGLRVSTFITHYINLYYRIC